MNGIKVLILLMTLILSFTALGRNVIGTDDRVNAPHRVSPYQAVGKLVTPTGSHCTATLISKDLILTNAHCLVDELKPNIRITGTYTFYSELGRTPLSSVITHYWYGTLNPKADRKNDWAFMRLKEPLGKTLGWLSVKEKTFIDVSSKPVTMLGYSNDWERGDVASIHYDCNIREDKSPVWHHDCDSTRGASGSPMIQGNKIVAVHAAEFRFGATSSVQDTSFGTHPNVAVPAASFIARLKAVLKADKKRK